MPRVGDIGEVMSDVESNAAGSTLSSGQPARDEQAQRRGQIQGSTSGQGYAGVTGTVAVVTDMVANTASPFGVVTALPSSYGVPRLAPTTSLSCL